MNIYKIIVFKTLLIFLLVATCVEMNVALHRLKDGLAVNEASQRTPVSEYYIYIQVGVTNAYPDQVKVKGSTASFQFDKVLPGPYVGKCYYY